MKKFLGLFLMVTMFFVLSACREVEEVLCEDNQTLIDGVCVDVEEDITPPVLSGVVDKTIYIDEDFDPMEGVTAIDDVDGDITDQIVFTGTYDTSKVGNYFLRYSVEDDAGNRTERTRYLTVTVNPELIGDEMVPNGDFSLGWAIWSATTGLEGGTANFTVVDGELNIEVTGAASAGWEPRLENQGITFEEGKLYQLTFEARALQARAIRVQIGELLPSAPWFVRFAGTVIDIDTTMQEYTFVFTMANDTNEKGSLLFEFGQVASPEGNDNWLTTVFLDNVVIIEIDPSDVVDTEAPVIMGIEDRTIILDAEFDPLEGVTVMDNIDGNIEITLANVSGTVDATTPGDYVLTYIVSDEAGNVTVETRTITVAEPLDDDALKDADYGWRTFGENADVSYEIVDGEFVLTAENIATTANWNIQIIQDTLGMGGFEEAGTMLFEMGKTYRVTFDARASVAGDITLAIGHAVGGWTPYHMEAVTVTTTMATYTVEFTLDDTDADYTTLAQFKFEMGLLFEGQTTPQTFFLDNVMIEVKENDVFTDAELVVNGLFEAEEPAEGSIFGWRAFLHLAGGEMEFSPRGQLVLTLMSISVTDNWHIQIIQDAYSLGTGADNVGSLIFEAGKTYRVTFDARSTVPGDIIVNVGWFDTPTNSWTAYNEEDVVGITDELTTYSFEFTLDDPEMDYSVPAQFKFEIGKMFQGSSAPQSFTLDNVILEVKENDVFVDSGLLENGLFDLVIEED